MTLSFVKLCFRCFATFSFAFSGSRECAYSSAHTVSCEKIVYNINTRVYSYLLRKTISQAREWLGKMQHSPEKYIRMLVCIQNEIKDEKQLYKRPNCVLQVLSLLHYIQSKQARVLRYKSLSKTWVKPKEPVCRSRHWAVKKHQEHSLENRQKWHSIDTRLNWNHKFSNFWTQK